jgi:GT2 family glycosyltransferase
MHAPSTPWTEVTIVVVPRERFSYTRDCLESVYAHTDVPFRLVCVDGGSPSGTRQFLRTQAEARGFELVRTDHYLSPNRARNLGLSHVTTPYVVFMDNDVVVAPGWLGPLLRCAKQTGAAVVGPLNCEGPPLHEIIHFAGGDCRIEETSRHGHIEQTMIDTIDRQGQRLADVRYELKRQRTSVAEFHCLLVRTAIFEKTGPFDEAMLTVRENLDFCLAVAAAGGAIYIEPASIITYLGYQPLAWRDLPYYLLRWNDRWTLSSLHRFRDKWQLSEDDYFQRQYRGLQRWRRDTYVIRPLLGWIPFATGRRALERALRPIERVVSRLTVMGYAYRHPTSRS